MRNYNDWEFLINGDSQEIRHYTTEKGTTYFRFYGGIDHYNDCQNEDFRFNTIYCQDETDVELVWQLGYELVSLFNGASYLFDRNYLKLSIESVWYKDKKVDFKPKRGCSALLRKPKLNSHEIQKQLISGKESSVKFWLLQLATENEDIYFFLKYLDLQGSWTNYYKLMEAIETFAKEKNVDLDTNKTEQKKFTNTANNYSLSGFDSRHGFKELTKSNKTGIMSIDGAHEFVTKMAKKYICEVYHC